MSKTILLVHGRSFKPPKPDLFALWHEALRFGIDRDYASALGRFDAAHIELVYYGDISNAFLAADCEIAVDAVPGDIAGRRATLDDLKRYGRSDFTREAYRALPGRSSIGEAIADALGSVLSLTRLSNPIIELIAPDMREYWNEDTEFGSRVREPMIEPMKCAMDRDDDICIIAHSLGSLIAYDTLWKVSHNSEYRKDYSHKRVDLFMTLGSPLADETVKRQIKGGNVSGSRRYPQNMHRWINVAAEDDYISHDQKAADDYAPMQEHNLIYELADERIYNLAVRNGKSNPHHDCGYLIHPCVADAVAGWLGGGD